VLLAIPDILSSDAARAMRARLDTASWIDGNATSGHQSALAKRNRQIAETDPIARELGDGILDALAGSPLFISAALPRKTYPPLFNRYEGGETFGTHIDNAIRPIRGTHHRVRTDLSATLFLTPPEEYDGGELVIDDTYGPHQVKLPAGHLILYPASSLHRVNPVTRGARVGAFFWVESMVRDDPKRTLLFDLDSTVRSLAAEKGQADPHVIGLTGIYHNLLRQWAET
jgi:PKHD-type hydroxylase